jgi:hypothetical protein
MTSFSKTSFTIFEVELTTFLFMKHFTLSYATNMTVTNCNDWGSYRYSNYYFGS